MTVQLAQIVKHLEMHGVTARLVGDPFIEIKQVAALNHAKNQEISFLKEKKYRPFLATTHASAVLLPDSLSADCSVACIVVPDPYYAYALVAQLLNPVKHRLQGVHQQAYIQDNVTLGSSITVEAFAVVYEGSVIGDGTYLCAGAVIEEGVTIGKSCRIGPNVVIHQGCMLGDFVTIEAGSIIGGDGFGWANHDGQWVKIPQVGRVIIGSHVSIGNNCTIDRGALDDTLIGDHCIIDNLVHIAHNVTLGKGCAIAGQSGLAGSAVLGDYCTVAGQSGITGHITVTSNTHLMAKSAVTHSLSEPGTYAGFPAVPVNEWRKNVIRIRQLEKMAQQLKELQTQYELIAQQAV
ncbi:UDP-3-O-(3-hydroxymyristoyl)glucosamine N-acyltransferase [Thiomicrorhabdus aquaedulcis]|uniref:UDP-3-O-(3-hydroxymyristoyl)glucosamine N-acyltransferase n=1 Tax=Thiomicrorhabdus aquaedulcis TaxID=2211106 RepID=UPI000FDAACDF|nr:UDP-3-O-(3-hydroxymyristoyl)glucosamine N-acyltransferase [Thiomicrorhabdus aquaedulcis]